VSYDSGLGTNVFTVLKANEVTTSFAATGLETGKTYIFKVQARNSYDLSDYSNSVTVLAAQTPD
jgi:hypothetical protein